MRVEGVKYTCNRCGKVEFLPWNPITANRYMDEELHKTWLDVDKDNNIHLCPGCACEYKKLFGDFMSKHESMEGVSMNEEVNV